VGSWQLKAKTQYYLVRLFLLPTAHCLLPTALFPLVYSAHDLGSNGKACGVATTLGIAWPL
jgi:hypothetical protein